MKFGNFIEQAEQEDPKAKRLKMLKRQVLQKKVQAVRQGAGEDIVASHEPEGEMVEGVGDAVKKGLKRHKDAVEKKKIKNRKAVPYAALAAEHQPEGEMVESKEKKGRHPRDQKELDRAQEYIKKNPKFGLKEHHKKPGEDHPIEEELSRRSKPSAKAKMAKLDAVLKRREERKIAEKEALKTEGWLGKKKEEKKPQKAMDAGARAKRKLQRKEYAAKVSGSEDNVPDEMREGVGRALGNAAKGAAGYAAQVAKGAIGSAVKGLSDPDHKPNAAEWTKKKPGSSSSSSSKEGGASAAKTQADKAKKARLDARKKAIQKIKDDRRERATNIMTAEKAAKKVKKEGEDKKFKADSEKPIVAEFVDHLWEAKKCPKCGKKPHKGSCSTDC